MTENNLIPSPELVEQWEADWHCSGNTDGNGFTYFVATRAAAWGADTELDACCAWLFEEPLCASNTHRKLRAARRRKPPSLKEQALQALSEAVKMADDVPPEGICSGQADIIRRALEQLPE
jgi:hypothetical protein